MVPSLLTRAEVAELLRVSPRTIDRWVTEGRLSRVQLARAVRFRADDIAGLLNTPTNETRPAGGPGVSKVVQGDHDAGYQHQ